MIAQVLVRTMSVRIPAKVGVTKAWWNGEMFDGWGGLSVYLGSLCRSPFEDKFFWKICMLSPNGMAGAYVVGGLCRSLSEGSCLLTGFLSHRVPIGSKIEFGRFSTDLLCRPCQTSVPLTSPASRGGFFAEPFDLI